MSEENYAVSDGMVVDLAYTLYVNDTVEDSASVDAPLEFIQGANVIIPGLEKALEGMHVGETKTVVVKPEDGYGDYDEESIIELERSLFPADYEFSAGRAVSLQDDATGQQLVGYINDHDEDHVHIDLNHPMAGKTLRFECEIVALRPATEEEMEAGTTHDDGCCSDCGHCDHGCC